MPVSRRVLVLLVGLSLACLYGGSPARAVVAWKPPPATVRVDTGGRDELDERAARRQLRREIRELEREIRREERAARTGRPAARGDGQRRGLAVAGFICALLGVLVVGPLGSLLGIVFGAIAYGRARRRPERYGGRNMALAGLIIGIVGLVLYVGLLVFALGTGF